MTGLRKAPLLFTSIVSGSGLLSVFGSVLGLSYPCSEMSLVEAISLLLSGAADGLSSCSTERRRGLPTSDLPVFDILALLDSFTSAGPSSSTRKADEEGFANDGRQYRAARGERCLWKKVWRIAGIDVSRG